jgi:hypothetical protein
MSTPVEMTPEEFDQWLKQNGDQLMQKAERSALNYLAAEQARALAAKTTQSQQSSSETTRSKVKA